MSGRTGTDRARPELIDRPRLLRLFDEAPRRLAVLVAGPGYGKSTLIDQWVRGAQSVWCDLRPADAELGHLARRLVRALEPGSPGLDAIAANAGADELASADALSTALCEALYDGPQEPAILILDDAQVIPSGSASARVLEGLVRQGPPFVRVIVGSRNQLPFPIERLRGRGEVLAVDAADLAFTQHEVAEVLEARGLEAAALAATVYDLTGGWPATVVLAADALGRRAPGRREEILAWLTRHEGPLSPYLTEEVISGEPTEVRDLLRLLAPLDRFSAPLCGALGLPRAGEILADLARRGVMLVPDAGADGSFRLHGFARRYLADALPLSDAERVEVCRVAAAWWEAEDRLDDALDTLTKTDDPADIRMFLERHAETLLRRRDAALLVRAYSALPSDECSPEIQLAAAHGLLDLGQYGTAATLLEDLAGDADAVPAPIASRLASIYATRDEIAGVRKILARARRDEATPADEARLLFAEAWALGLEGNLPDGVPIMARAVEAARAAADDYLLFESLGTLGVLTSLHGDLDRARVLESQAFAVLERIPDRSYVERKRQHRANALLREGRYADALEDADAAVRAADVGHDRRDQNLAYSLFARGAILFRLGRVDEAVRDLQEADGLARVSRLARLGGMVVLVLGYVYRSRGDIALARARYEEGIRLLHDACVPHEKLHAEVGLATVITGDDPADAVARVRCAVAALGGAEDPEIYIEAGWVELVAGNRDRARAHAEVAVVQARRERDPANIAAALELGALVRTPPDPGLLEEAAAIWRRLGSPVAEACVSFAIARLSNDADVSARQAECARVLERFGVRTSPVAATLLGALPSVRGDTVQIRTLGGFDIFVGGVPIPASAWPSKKARDLLKIMLARRGVPTHREVVMECLWPGQEPGALGNRYAVMVSGLRATLDPDRAWPQDHFVKTETESIALDVDHLSVDVERFFAVAQRGLSRFGAPDRRELLEEAETIYRGDFLEENVYDEWTHPLRERARAVFGAVESALARDAVDRGDHGAAGQRFLRILERDPFDESAHLGLISSTAAAGHHGEARRRYRSYVKRMRELEVEPAPYPNG